MADDTISRDEFERFKAWQRSQGQGAADAKPDYQNGAFCNADNCGFDSRAELDETGAPTGERDDSVDALPDVLAALDHNAINGHHVTVKTAGADFQINPRTAS